MFRKAFLAFCLLALVSAPLLAQSPQPTRAQLENQRDLLQRYSARLMEVNDKYGVFQKILDLANQDQIDALNSLRISPSQAMELVKLVQANLPSGPLDDVAMKNLQKTLQPQMEQLLGSDQFDLILQLFPSPQQKAQAEAIMAEASNTPEGQAAYQAAQDLSAALTPDQRSFLNPFLSLAKAPTAGTAPLAAVPAPPAPGSPSRNLVNLRRCGAGDFFADVTPDMSYLTHLPRTYRVQGGDPNLMSAVATSSGTPVRLLSTINGDVIQIARVGLLGSPAMLAVSGGHPVWRGKLPARVTNANPPTVELDLGRGQKLTATLEMTSSEQQAFAAAGQSFTVEGTCELGTDKNVLYDVVFSPYTPPGQNVSSAALIQLSEEFFNHCASEYLNGHASELNYGGPSDLLNFRVTEIGLTLSGVQGSQARVFGMGVLSHSGLDVLSAQFEMTGQISCNGTNITLAPVPGSLLFRVNYPFFAQAPASWGTRLEQIMGPEYLKGYSFALPDDYQSKLTSTGLVTAEQLDGVKIVTLPTEDRRTALVAMAVPSTIGVQQNPLMSRIQFPGEGAVAVPEGTINDVIKNQLPGKMPLMIAVPEDMQEQSGGVKFKQIEIAELDCAFADGVLKINSCTLNVHWRYGIFAGVEPAVKFSGIATLVGTGDPTQIAGKLTIDQLTIISPRLLAMPQADQDNVKQEIMKATSEKTLPLPFTQKLAIPAFSNNAALVPTGAGGSTNPSELLLQGRLSPP